MEEQDDKPSTGSMQSRVGEIKGGARGGRSARNNALKGQPDHSPGQAKRHPGNRIGIINEQRPERAEA